MEILCTLIGGWFLAELFGGIFHWFEDRYGNPDWPILGKWVVQPNIEHHKQPGKICKGSYWHRNNTTMIPCLILAGAFFWCPVLCLAFLLLSHMNEFHSWAHQKCNPVIRFFQKLGILQSCKHHKIHHERPYDKNYCVMTNYLNPVLRVIGFWNAMEWLVFKTIGVEPLEERAIY